MNRLETLAEQLGVTIIESAQLPEGVDGAYIHHQRAILLRTTLDYWTKRCTLAHELGHAVYGDEACDLPGIEPRMERRADQWAAQMLISECEYAAAEALHEGNHAAIAHALDVTPELLHVWQTTYLRKNHYGKH